MLLTDTSLEIFAEAGAFDPAVKFEFPGLKLCGLRSQHGRMYSEACLAEAVQAGLYDSVPICIETRRHKDTPAGQYKPLFEHAVGYVKQPAFRPGQGVFGTAVLNPHHVFAEAVAWDIQRKPKFVGFSQMAEVEANPERTQVCKISKVYNLDLVLHPATMMTFAEGGDPELEAAAQEVMAAQIEALAAHPKFQELLAAHKADVLKAVQEWLTRAPAEAGETVADSFPQILKHCLSEYELLAPPKPVALRPNYQPPAPAQPIDFLAQAKRRSGRVFK